MREKKVSRAKPVPSGAHGVRTKSAGNEKKGFMSRSQVSDELYRLLFENSGDAIILAHPDGTISAANPEACRLFGRTEGEFKKIGRAGIVDSKEPRLPAAIEEGRRTGRFRGELNHVKKDGIVFPCDVKVKRFKDSSGNVRTSLIIRDLTERKRMEKEIQNLARFPSENPNPVLRIARDGTLLYINEAGLNLLPEWHLHVGQAASPMLREAALQAMDRGSPQMVDFEHGQQVYLFSITPIVGAGYANLYARNVTERKQAEEALRESEEKYRILFTSSSDAIMLVEPLSGKFTSGNQTMMKMFGLKNDDDFSSFGPWDFSPEWQPDGRASAEKAKEMNEIAMRDGSNFFEWTHKRLNGEEFSANVRLTRMVLDKKTILQATVRDITERKRAEEALREANERLLLAIVAGGVGIWDLDVVNNKLTWDDQMFRLYGITPDNFGGAYEAWKARVHPEDVERGDAELQMALRDRKEFDTEFRVVWPSGAIHHIRARARVHRDAAGQPTKLIGTNYDITERKRAEEELRKSEERFKLIFEYAPDAYYLNDLKGIFIDGNKTAENITGYKREELIGGSFLKLNMISLDQLPKAAKLLAKNAMGMATGPDEFILRRKTGDKVHVEISTHPVKIENRTVVLGIARDITERMQTEETLRESEEKYRTLVENAAEAIVIVQEGMLKFVNRRTSEITGYSEQELLSMPFLEFIHQDDRAMVGENYVKHLKGDVSIPRYAFRLINKDGSFEWVEINAVLVDWEGKPATLKFLSDITERKRAEEALETERGLMRTLIDNLPDKISSSKTPKAASSWTISLTEAYWAARNWTRWWENPTGIFSLPHWRTGIWTMSAGSSNPANR